MSRFRGHARLTVRSMIALTTLTASTLGCSTIVEPIVEADAAVDAGAAVALSSRIFVADGEAVIGLDRVAQAPPFEHAIRFPGAGSLAFGGGLLFAARPGSDAVAIFDDVAGLHPERSPSRVLDDSETGGGLPAIRAMEVDVQGTLWVLLADDELRAFFRATERLDGGSFSPARFVDGRLLAFAVDAPRDRLYAGPGDDGGHVLVWVDALTRESLGPSSFALGTSCEVRSLALAGSLAAGCESGAIHIWGAPESATAGTPHDRTLQARGAVESLVSVGGRWVAVGPAGVDVFEDGARIHELNVPGRRAVADSSGTLFVLDDTRVTAIATVTTNPEVLGGVRSGRAPLDLALD